MDNANWQREDSYRPISFWPLHSFINLMDQIKRFGIYSNCLGNTVLFLPVGTLFPICFSNRFFSTVFFCVLLTVSIEFLQLLLSRGYFEIDDLVSNIAGAIVGWSIYRIVKFLKQRLLSDARKYG